MNILLIEITPRLVVFSLLAIILIILSLLSLFKKKQPNFEEKYNIVNDSISRDEVIHFSFENKTDEEITLDLFKLDANDERYSFYTPNGDYDMFVEYMKINSVFVSKTRTTYNDVWSNLGIPNYLKNCIYHNSYSPFGQVRFPALIAFESFNKNQFQSNIIDSDGSYTFDYFNRLEINLLPKSKMAIVLFCSDYDKLIKRQPLKYALCVKNISNETQMVELFDEAYWIKAEEDKTVELSCIYDKVSYKDVIGQSKVMPVTAKDIKFIITKENSNSIFKINNDVYNLIDCVTTTQMQPNVIDVNFKDEKYIHNISVELKPNTEMLISLK